MHQVKKMSDLNPKINLIDRLMVKAHRKQIPPFQGMPHEKKQKQNIEQTIHKKTKTKKTKKHTKKILK